MNQEYLDLVWHLDEIRQRDVVCLVEGKKDREALLSFNIEKIVAINSRPKHEVIEDIITSYGNFEVAILTDLDHEGRKIYKRFNSGLQEHGVKIYKAFRDFSDQRTHLHQIEGLPTYISTIMNGTPHNHSRNSFNKFNHLPSKSNGKHGNKFRNPYYPNSFY